MMLYHESMEPDPSPTRLLAAEVEALKKDSHPPVDIAPRIYDEMERMVKLGRIFYEVPTEDLDQAAAEGLVTYNYLVEAKRR